jgi:excisionase family DNA binding protein
VKDTARPLADPVLYTFAEAAHMTSIPETWLRKAVTSRRIAFRKIGKHVRFAQADIDALVSSTAVEPTVRRSA